MLKQSLNELKQIAKMRGIKGYERISQERLSSINDSEREKENNFDGARIEKFNDDFNKLKDRFSKPKESDQKISLKNRKQKNKRD